MQQRQRAGVLQAWGFGMSMSRGDIEPAWKWWSTPSSFGIQRWVGPASRRCSGVHFRWCKVWKPNEMSFLAAPRTAIVAAATSAIKTLAMPCSLRWFLANFFFVPVVNHTHLAFGLDEGKVCLLFCSLKYPTSLILSGVVFWRISWPCLETLVVHGAFSKLSFVFPAWSMSTFEKKLLSQRQWNSWLVWVGVVLDS